jgi:hypothetical protein
MQEARRRFAAGWSRDLSFRGASDGEIPAALGNSTHRTISIGRVGGETLHNVRLLDAYGPQPEAQPR